jgi:hypothetical protein
MWDLKVPFGTGGDSDYDERGTDSTIAETVVLVVRDIIDVRDSMQRCPLLTPLTETMMSPPTCVQYYVSVKCQCFK